MKMLSLRFVVDIFSFPVNQVSRDIASFDVLFVSLLCLFGDYIIFLEIQFTIGSSMRNYPDIDTANMSSGNTFLVNLPFEVDISSCLEMDGANN